MMTGTAFPATPADVATLTAQEFRSNLEGLDVGRGPSPERVYQTFIGDVNRSLVWWIRFRALRVWWAQAGESVHSTPGASVLREICEIASSCPLNGLWEFDPASFKRAVDEMNRDASPDGDSSTEAAGDPFTTPYADPRADAST
ncbi:MAG: hypothetical protein AB7N65_07765 [Vicinamibacterales bacterium]